MEVLKKIKRKIKKVLFYSRLNRENVKLDKKVYITFECEFEGFNVVRSKTYIDDSFIGKFSYIENNCFIKKTKIGRFCSIASNLKIIDGNHPTSLYVSTHPFTYTNRKFAGLSSNHVTNFAEHSYTSEEKKWFCEIGNDVWIGENVLILAGCKIGDGAIVAAGTVVTKDVEPYSIVAGVPARKIKMRFCNTDIEFLLQFKWWERDIGWIMQNISLFDDIEEFRRNISRDDSIIKSDL